MAHEAPLREISAFFEAALGRDWKEAADRVIKLPEEAPDQFHVYVHWLYRGLYRGMKNGSQFSPHDLARLYTLGSRLQDHDFQDAVVDAFIYRCGRIPMIPDDNIVYLIFSNTIEDDPMRPFLVHVRVRAGVLGTFDNEIGGHMAEFYFDVAKAAMEGPKTGVKHVVSEGQGTCKYHQHGDQPCYRAERT